MNNIAKSAEQARQVAISEVETSATQKLAIIPKENKNQF